MQVFHYLAHELRDEAIFDNALEDILDTGAIYNDFDATPIDALLSVEETASFSLSQPSAISSPIAEHRVQSIQVALDNAVMEEDRSVGVLYEHLCFESEYFDNESEECNEEYCTKVHVLAKNENGEWDSLNVSTEAISMFQRRQRTNWSAPDTVYDAWLLRNGFERAWFNTHLFNVLFPEFDYDGNNTTITDTPVEEDGNEAKLPEVQNIRIRFSSTSSEDSAPMSPAVASSSRYIPTFDSTTTENESERDENVNPPPPKIRKVKRKMSFASDEDSSAESHTMNDDSDTKSDTSKDNGTNTDQESDSQKIENDQNCDNKENILKIFGPHVMPEVIVISDDDE